MYVGVEHTDTGSAVSYGVRIIQEITDLWMKEGGSLNVEHI